MQYKDYIKEAKEFVKEAEKEFVKGIKEKSLIILRDACEKAWGATVQAVNGLLIKEGWKELPKTNWERRKALNKLEEKEDRFKEMGFRDRFMARCNLLHSAAFYDGSFDPDEIKLEFQKVKELIEKVGKI